MTQALNLANLANHVNTSGQLDASQALIGTVTSTGLSITGNGSISGTFNVGKLGVNTTTPTGTAEILSTGPNETNVTSTDPSAGAAYVNVRADLNGGTGYYRAFRGMDSTGTTTHWAAGQYGCPENNYQILTYNGSGLIEGMRITPVQTMFIGTTTNYQNGRLTVKGISGTDTVAEFQSGDTRVTGNVWFVNNGNSVGVISYGTTTCAYLSPSDYRLKEDIAPMIGALDTIAKLKPITYTWKLNGEKADGFLAHELKEVFPNAVHGEKDAVKEDGTILPQSIDTSFIVATLTAAIQELNAKVTDLEEKLKLAKI